MDKTKDTQENSLQGSGKASEGSKETTPKAEAKTYTQEEHDKALQTDRIKRGRDDKSLADREATLNAEKQAIEARRAELDEIQKQMDEAELEAAKGDPDKLKELQAKKSYKDKLKELQKREAELNRREAENAAKIKAAEEATMEMKLFELASEFEVDVMDIKAKMEELGLTTVEQAEKVAKMLPKKAETPETPEEAKMKVDSGVNTGAGGKSEEQKLKERYPSMK